MFSQASGSFTSHQLWLVHSESGRNFKYFDYSIDFLFWVDMVLNFRLGFFYDDRGSSRRAREATPARRPPRLRRREAARMLL